MRRKDRDMDYRDVLKNKHRIVVKIGTSSLSYPNGRMNFQSIEKLAYVLSAIRGSGIQVMLVTSGAIGVGAGKAGADGKTPELDKKQALAAVGQAELMKIYQKFFEEYNQTVAQVLAYKGCGDNSFTKSECKKNTSQIAGYGYNSYHQ